VHALHNELSVVARVIEFPFDGPGGRKWCEAWLVPEHDGIQAGSARSS
jgi:hypothetical protein